MTIKYTVIDKSDFEESHRAVLADMLGKQQKVQGQLVDKIDRCKTICVAYQDGVPIAIGAIKQKTRSYFDTGHAGLPELSEHFDWELGYLYTRKESEGKGVGSYIVRLLLDSYGPDNLMASTELSTNPAMIRILEHNGFRHYGTPWRSSIHNKHLGLFLRFE